MEKSASLLEVIKPGLSTLRETQNAQTSLLKTHNLAVVNKFVTGGLRLGTAILKETLNVSLTLFRLKNKYLCLI